MSAFGVVGTAAPEQVVERLEELGVLEGRSSARRILTLVAHWVYGMGIETALGLLRRERRGAANWRVYALC